MKDSIQDASGEILDEEDCTVCVHPHEDEIEELTAKGVKPREITDTYTAIDRDHIAPHMIHHTADTVSDAQLKDKLDMDKYQLVVENLNEIQKQLKYLLEHNDFTPESTNQLVATSKELRNWLELHSEFEKERQKRLKITEEKYEKLKSIVMHEVDVDTQDSIIDRLEQVEEQDNEAAVGA